MNIRNYKFEGNDLIEEAVTNAASVIANEYFSQNGMKELAEDHDDDWYGLQEELREAILKKSAEIASMYNVFTPAPLDDKNVMTDWIEEVFDWQSGLYHKNQCVGFIFNCPVLATWHDNVLTWHFISEEFKTAQSVLCERLKEKEDVNSELFSQLEIVYRDVKQYFYWREV